MALSFAAHRSTIKVEVFRPWRRTITMLCSALAILPCSVSDSSASAAKATSGPMPDVVMAIKGSCNSLKVRDKDLTRTCKGTVLNTIYSKLGRTGFYFVSGDVLVTFSGQAEQIKPDPDTAVQPLDRIIFSYQGKADPPDTAVGQCRYTNPYAGPAHVDCHAETARGDFDASFLSDGNPPDRIK